MVSTHLKNISQIGWSPQVGLKIKNIWNHHPEKHCSKNPPEIFFRIWSVLILFCPIFLAAEKGPGVMFRGPPNHFPYEGMVHSITLYPYAQLRLFGASRSSHLRSKKSPVSRGWFTEEYSYLQGYTIKTYYANSTCGCAHKKIQARTLNETYME